MSRNAPICVDSAARRAMARGADGDSESASGAAECVCRKAKAQGVRLRERGSRRDATVGLRVGGMALASHYGINL